MRVSVFVISLLLFGILCDCGNENSVNQTTKPIFRLDTTATGYGTVAGYQGYFSAELGPNGDVSIVPSGYVMTNYTWERGGPADTSHQRICLFGRETEHSRAIRVRSTGGWGAMRATYGVDTFRYIKMSIDSLQVLK